MMEKSNIYAPLFADFWSGWRKWAAWSACIGIILALGVFRTATGAEFTFASLVLLPVLFISWVGGKWNGLVMAFLGAAMWVSADIVSEKSFFISWLPWANAVTRLLTYCVVAVLTAQVRLQFDREREHASRDVLTGLLNRRAFLDAGTAEVERSSRYAHPLAVVFLDLDNFKQLNDTQGHDAGDTALRSVSQALLTALRATDYVSRLGGDEFAVLLPEVGYEEADDAGRKIFAAVNGALRGFSPVTASIGVAHFGKADQPFTSMMKVADELMYEVKSGGKNNFQVRRAAVSDRSGTLPASAAGRK